MRTLPFAIGLSLVLPGATLRSQTCAATPEAAARAALGGSASGASSTAGYRVDEVQTDPVLRRVWVRVVRCGDASAPAVLVPISAPLRWTGSTAEAGLHPSPSSVTSSSALPMQTSAVSSPPVIVVHFGDAVHAVFASSAVRMELDAIAKQQGSVGDTIALTLKRRADEPLDEPEHRIHGTVRADKTVEVTP